MDMDRTKLYRIVVVGGGFGGLRTALELDKRRARIGKCEVTVVDRQCEHVYTPLLYEVCAGELETSGVEPVKALRSGVAFSLPAFMGSLRHGRLKFAHGAVQAIDHEAKTVTLDGGRVLPFDTIVLSPGVTINTFGVPGVEESACMLKPLGGSLMVRQKLCQAVEALGKGATSVRVVVCGAGATGTEFASEVAHWMLGMESSGQWKAGTGKVTLVEAGPSLLAMFPARTQVCARDRLVQLRIDLRLQTAVTGMEQGRVHVKNVVDGKEQQETIEADVIVWTAGIKPHAAVATWGVALDAKGSIDIEPTFHVKNMPNVYALGDATVFLHPKTHARVPALAQAAIKQASIVAENIVRALERKLPIIWTPPEKWISVIPLGGAYAVTNIGHVTVSGYPGFVIRRAVDLIYFLSILPPRAAWRIWRKGMEEFGKNDVRATIPVI